MLLNTKWASIVVVILLHDGVLLQFVRVLACGQKANESLEFLKSHRRVGPLAEITA